MNEDQSLSLLDLHKERGTRVLAKQPQAKVTLMQVPPEYIEFNVAVSREGTTVQIAVRCVLNTDRTVVDHVILADCVSEVLTDEGGEIDLIKAHAREIAMRSLRQPDFLSTYYVGCPSEEVTIDALDSECGWLMKFTPYDLALRFLYQLKDEERKQLMKSLEKKVTKNGRDAIAWMNVLAWGPLPFATLQEHSKQWSEDHMRILIGFFVHIKKHFCNAGHVAGYYEGFGCLLEADRFDFRSETSNAWLHKLHTSCIVEHLSTFPEDERAQILREVYEEANVDAQTIHVMNPELSFAKIEDCLRGQSDDPTLLSLVLHECRKLIPRRS